MIASNAQAVIMRGWMGSETRASAKGGTVGGPVGPVNRALPAKLSEVNNHGPSSFITYD